MAPPLRLPTTVSVIYGSFTLGFYVAIQGPTLMDIIDFLHVNNDIMSYTLAFASLAYSVGGLLSGCLFNYIDRQILIIVFHVIFGTANTLTPYMSNYYVFSVITVFKMMCAGGIDCAGNVWILELWPGKDAWLQALHFMFAVGCALGPLIVEPFLSVEQHKESDFEAILKHGSTLINDQNNESRIHIPYAVSGAASYIAAVTLLYLYMKERKLRRVEAAKRLAIQQGATSNDHISLAMQPLQVATLPAITANSSNATISPLQLEAGDNQAVCSPDQTICNAHLVPAITDGGPVANQTLANNNTNNTVNSTTKISSKAKEQAEGRPPYYVMFAIALAALCLSFYCGIEITSMNYLATFAVNIDLQLPKSTAALMSSALTISFAIGRGFGIWIAAYVRPHRLFYLCAAVMATGNVFMLIFANTAETLLWYSICLFGIGCGPALPAIVSFYDDKIAKVTNTVSGIFILGSMFNVALNSLIIGHYIIDNALILIVCNLIGSVLLAMLFGTLHMLTRVKKNQRIRKFKMQQQKTPPLIGSDQESKQKQLLQQETTAAAAAAAAADEQTSRAPQDQDQNQNLDSNQNQQEVQSEQQVALLQPVPTDKAQTTSE